MIEYEINIVSFILNSTRTGITLNLQGVNSTDSIYLFKHSNYKEYDKAIDLMEYYNSNTNSIETDILLSELNQSYLDGIYILEVEQGEALTTEIQYSFVRYKECILNKVLKLSLCDDCLKTISPSIINANTLLESLLITINEGYLLESINIINSLNKYCSDDCKSCGEYNTKEGSNYFSFTKDEELPL